MNTMVFSCVKLLAVGLVLLSRECTPHVVPTSAPITRLMACPFNQCLKLPVDCPKILVGDVLNYHGTPCLGCPVCVSLCANLTCAALPEDCPRVFPGSLSHQNERPCSTCPSCLLPCGECPIRECARELPGRPEFTGGQPTCSQCPVCIRHTEFPCPLWSCLPLPSTCDTQVETTEHVMGTQTCPGCPFCPVQPPCDPPICPDVSPDCPRLIHVLNGVASNGTCEGCFECMQTCPDNQCTPVPDGCSRVNPARVRVVNSEPCLGCNVCADPPANLVLDGAEDLDYSASSEE